MSAESLALQAKKFASAVLQAADWHAPGPHSLVSQAAAVAYMGGAQLAATNATQKVSHACVTFPPDPDEPPPQASDPRANTNTTHRALFCLSTIPPFFVRARRKPYSPGCNEMARLYPANC
jgi:hypothetical protein